MLNLFVIIAKREIYEIDEATRILEPQSTKFLIIPVHVFYSHGDIELERVSVWFAYTTTFCDMFNYMYKYAPSTLQNTMGM